MSINAWPKGSVRAVHVKAHRRGSGVSDGKEKVLWIGNWIADAVAKAGAKHRQVNEAIREAYSSEFRRYKELAKLAGTVMVNCAKERPWAKEGKRWITVREEQGITQDVAKHIFITVGKHLARCANCPQVANTAMSVRRMRCLPCKGSLEGRAAKGHLLMRSSDIIGSKLGIIWCRRCGSYAESVPKGLSKPCVGEAGRAGTRNIKLLTEGWHPRTWRKLQAPVPIKGTTLEDRIPEGRGGEAGVPTAVAGHEQRQAAGRAEGREEQISEPTGAAGQWEEEELWPQEEEAFEEPPDEEFATIMAEITEQEGMGPPEEPSVGRGGLQQRSGGLGTGSAPLAEEGSERRVAAPSVGKRARSMDIWNYNGVLTDTTVPNFDVKYKMGSNKRSKFRF